MSAPLVPTQLRLDAPDAAALELFEQPGESHSSATTASASVPARPTAPAAAEQLVLPPKCAFLTGETLGEAKAALQGACMWGLWDLADVKADCEVRTAWLGLADGLGHSHFRQRLSAISNAEVVYGHPCVAHAQIKRSSMRTLAALAGIWARDSNTMVASAGIKLVGQLLASCDEPPEPGVLASICFAVAPKLTDRKAGPTASVCLHTVVSAERSSLATTLSAAVAPLVIEGNAPGAKHCAGR